MLNAPNTQCVLNIHSIQKYENTQTAAELYNCKAPFCEERGIVESDQKSTGLHDAEIVIMHFVIMGCNSDFLHKKTILLNKNVNQLQLHW